MSTVISADFGMFSSYFGDDNARDYHVPNAVMHSPFWNMLHKTRDEIPFTVVVVGLFVLSAPCGLKAKTEQRPTSKY